jgi:glycosyltransferase involved in cell wall biosynthesis
MKVTTFLQDEGGCTHYRQNLPLVTAAKYNAIQYDPIRTTNLGEAKIYLPKQYFEMADSDVYVLGRPVDDSLGDMLRKVADARKKKAVIVVEHDDDVFNVSPLSPHYRDYGTQEVKIRAADGTIKDLWVDGENFSITKNVGMLDGIKRAFEKADIVTTTTEILADQFRQYNGNVRVLPNCVDLKRFERLPIVNKEIRLFWAGGWSHFEDWVKIKDPIRQIMDKYPNVKLVLMGYMWESTVRGIDPLRIECHEWEETPAYPLRLSMLNPDIAVIPLRDTVFNRCKSAIKWIEMSALGIPSVASYIPPYAAMSELGEDNGIFIEENDANGWVEGISLLIEDADMRKRMGESARKTVETHFDINTQFEQWVVAFEEALCLRPATLQQTK